MTILMVMCIIGDHLNIRIGGFMRMKKARTYSRYTQQAALLLGKHIQLARKERRWTEQDLVERAGIARATLQKIEKGDMRVAIGLVFEVASLVGVRLFDDESASVVAQLARTDDRLALLPRSVRRRTEDAIDDDF